jgi:hypothetical protein
MSTKKTKKPRLGKWLTNTSASEVEESTRKIKGKILVGPPKATEFYSALQLEVMGLVGIYRPRR